MESLLHPRSIADTERTLKLARDTLNIEADAVRALATKLGDAFIAAHKLLFEASAKKGRVVVTGMGKSGHIGGKIASTLASTGTPAFFMHPGEASHGDLGMITKDDVVIAISNSPKFILDDFCIQYGFDKVYGRIYELGPQDQFTGAVSDEHFISNKANIVKRILDYHNASIYYYSTLDNTNEFKVTLSN